MTLKLFLILLAFTVALPVHAFHFPWDQGHDTTDWNDPSDPGPCKGSKCDPCNSTGSPVYIPTGHFIWSDNDISLKGRPFLGITRTYNSHDPRDGLFGNGWSIGCDPGLYLSTEGASTKYVYRAANGKRYDYVVQPNGTVNSPPGRFERVVPQPDGSVAMIFVDARQQVFRRDGKLVADVDPNGSSVNYIYDAQDRLTQLADGNGRSLSFTYNSRGRVSSIADHAARAWRYEYDINGNLATVTDPLNGVQRYEYQPYTATGDGQTYYHLTKVTDASGIVTTQVTYTNERVASYSEEENRYTYSYNTATKTVTKTDRLGSRWTFVYNEEGLITRETDPLNNVVTFAYDTNGREIQRVDELGKIWSGAYDSMGRVLTRTNPLGEQFRFEYAESNPRPVRVISPSGRTTQFTYDTKLNATGGIDPSGAATRLEWNARGDLAARVDQLGNRTNLAYSTAGLPVSVVDPLGRNSNFSYDGRSNLVQIQNGAGEVAGLSYDALDRATRIVDPLNQNSIYTYDAAGRVLSVTDVAGGTTSYGYDVNGRVISSTGPDGRRQQYAYRQDNLLSQTTMPDGRTITYTYDAAKRLTQENAAGEITSYVYNARSELTQATSPGGTIARVYDNVGRLTQETVNGKVVQISNNAEGQRLSLTALGSTTNYAYDVRGLLTQITDPAGGYGFSYDTAGRRTQLQFPNAAISGYAYDAAGQLTSIAHSGPFAASYGYTFDTAGRITRQTGDGSDWNYRYDSLGRLTQADHGTDTQVYPYDAMGNLLSNGRVHDAGNRLTQDNDFTYTYDLNGNLTRKQHNATGARTVYSWNIKNQLLRVERYADASAATPIKVLVFTYDPMGRRASKTEDGLVERYVNDGDDLIGVLDNAGNTIRTFTFDAGIDKPLGMQTASGSRFFHANHIGSVMALTGAGVTSQYGYDAYGKTQVAGETINRFRFTAREQDLDDLYYYRARYYDPATQRFLSEDPLGLAGGNNLYRYAEANPVQFVDPYGLQASWADCAVKCGMEVLGLDDLVDIGLIASGWPIPGTKRFVTPGSSVGTSVAGMAADKVFGKARFPVRIPTIVGGFGTGRRLAIAGTRSVARFAGRAIPFIGWGLLAVDAIQFGICMKNCLDEDDCK